MAGPADLPRSASSATGSIYDLGYRRYDGPRLGRRHAFRAVFSHGLKAVFGIGRGGRAKLIPLGLGGMVAVPALIVVGIVAVTRRQLGGSAELPQLVGYGEYFHWVLNVVLLFVAAQGPEIVGRDLRYQVLPLYFSRALGRVDYALARLLALVVGLALVIFLPMLIIFLGLVISGTDLPSTLATELSKLPPVLAEGVATAAVLGAVALAVAAHTPRRAYATAAIIALLIVPPLVAAVIPELASGEWTRYPVLLSVPDVLNNLDSWLFGQPIGPGGVSQVPLPGPAFALAAVVMVVAAVGFLVRRYARISA
jgi:ABC-2 type transport system permease protein